MTLIILAYLGPQAVTRMSRSGICMHRKTTNISTVLAGQRLGIKEVEEGTWLVSFRHYDLGYFDDENCRLERSANSFGPKVLSMSPV